MSEKPSLSEKSSHRIQLWIAVIAGIATVVAAIVTVLPQLMPSKSQQTPSLTQPEKIDDRLDIYNPTPLPTEVNKDVSQGEATLLQAEITAVLQQAYSLKISSLRDLDTSSLDAVYTADALEYRIYVVDLALMGNCYWDIHPDQPETYDFEYLAESSARVKATRVETRFHYCNGELKTQNSISGDRYYVRYFLMHNDIGWQIYDTKTTDLPDD